MKVTIKISLITSLFIFLAVSCFWLVSSFIGSKIVIVSAGFTLVISGFLLTFFTTNHLLKITEKSKNREPEEAESKNDHEPFGFLKNADPKHLLTFIQQEHPQTIACVVSYLKPENAAVILQELPEEIRAEVLKRIAAMDKVRPEIIREVEQVLEKKLCTLSSADFVISGGIENAAEILNSFDPAVEQDIKNQIFDGLSNIDRELADELKKKLGKNWNLTVHPIDK